MSEDRNQKIIEQKSKLAEKVLKVAEQALGDIEATMGEAPVRDLINIFNSSIKVEASTALESPNISTILA